MTTIAIIDDDIYIGNMLEELLQANGYQVLRAYSGTEALYLLERTHPDLVLLDLMLPHIQDIPVIVLSAKVDVQDKVQLLLGGAADYMTKPFDTSELLARITVQLRQQSTRTASGPLRLGTLCLDSAQRSVRVGGQPIHLTPTEFAILKLLMQNPSQVLTKAAILERISHDTPDCTEHSLKQHISNLRRKLREVSGKDYIESVWGIGFKIADDA